jgi:hypothetical protein
MQMGFARRVESAVEIVTHLIDSFRAVRVGVEGQIERPGATPLQRRRAQTGYGCAYIAAKDHSPLDARGSASESGRGQTERPADHREITLSVAAGTGLRSLANTFQAPFVLRTYLLFYRVDRREAIERAV